MDVGEPVVAALETEGQTFVVQSEQVEQGGVDVVDMSAVGDWVET